MKKFYLDPTTATLVPADKKATLATYNDQHTSGATIILPKDFAEQYKDYKVFINYASVDMENADADLIETLSTDPDTGDVSFDWLLHDRATENTGRIIFNMCLKHPTNGNEYNTGVFKDVIQEGLEPSLTPDEEEKVSGYYDILIAGLEAKRDEIIASMPKDYTDLSEKVDSIDKVLIEEVQTDVETFTQNDFVKIVPGCIQEDGSLNSDSTYSTGVWKADSDTIVQYEFDSKYDSTNRCAMYSSYNLSSDTLFFDIGTAPTERGDSKRIQVSSGKYMALSLKTSVSQYAANIITTGGTKKTLNQSIGLTAKMKTEINSMIDEDVLKASLKNIFG